MTGIRGSVRTMVQTFFDRIVWLHKGRVSPLTFPLPENDSHGFPPRDAHSR